jgi:putative transposase
LSATNIARLTNEWETEYRAFQKRSLADRDYVFVWVQGVHLNVRLEDDRLCMPVRIGVRPDGTKALITVGDGYRGSAESWKTVLRDLKRWGMRPLEPRFLAPSSLSNWPKTGQGSVALAA